MQKYDFLYLGTRNLLLQVSNYTSEGLFFLEQVVCSLFPLHVFIHNHDTTSILCPTKTIVRSSLFQMRVLATLLTAKIYLVANHLLHLILFSYLLMADVVLVFMGCVPPPSPGGCRHVHVHV